MNISVRNASLYLRLISWDRRIETEFTGSKGINVFEDLTYISKLWSKKVQSICTYSRKV